MGRPKKIQPPVDSSHGSDPNIVMDMVKKAKEAAAAAAVGKRKADSDITPSASKAKPSALEAAGRPPATPQQEAVAKPAPPKAPAVLWHAFTTSESWTCWFSQCFNQAWQHTAWTKAKRAHWSETCPNPESKQRSSTRSQSWQCSCSIKSCANRPAPESKQCMRSSTLSESWQCSCSTKSCAQNRSAPESKQCMRSSTPSQSWQCSCSTKSCAQNRSAPESRQCSSTASQSCQQSHHADS